MILITGGTGLVGSHLLYKVLQTNARVRAIYRKEAKLALVKKVFSYYTPHYETLYNKIEWVRADITDIPSLKEAFIDIDYVYHCAAVVSFDPNKYHLLRKTNIEGTANVVNLCISNKVKKLGYISSIATIGHSPNKEWLTESTDWNADSDHNVYAITKYGAEIEVWRGMQEGVDAVILNPGIIIGPGFWTTEGSGGFIQQSYKGMPYYTHGITGYIDVNDVADAIWKLMAAPIKNERFIAVSESLSFKTVLDQTAQALNVKPPAREATTLILSIAWRLDWLRHLVTGRGRKLTRLMAQSAKSTSKYDASKLKNALDFVFKPIQNSINETCQLFLKDLKKEH